MAQQQTQKKYISPEEYLAMEEKAKYKSEYYNGEIFAMAGGSINHSTIAINITSELRQLLKGKPCWVYNSDVRVLVEENGLYTYPDVSVVCTEPKFAEGRNDTITNPLIIVEVLSESTKSYDRAEKFELYRAIKSFQDYILIDQDRVYIEYFHKNENGLWILQVINNIDETLTIHSIASSIPLREIYDKVEWKDVR